MSAKVIFTHEGNIIVCYILQGKQNFCYLKAKTYTIAKDRISFEQVSSAKLPLKCSSNEVCLLICKLCRDVNTGLVLPMFTVLRRTPDKQKVDILYIIALEASTRLVTINRVCVHKEWRFDKKDFDLIEGPSLVWTHKNNLYIARNQNIDKYDFDVIEKVTHSDPTVLWCGVVNKNYLIIGVTSNKTKDIREEQMDTEENDGEIMVESSKFFVISASITSRNGNCMTFDALNESDFVSAAYSQNVEKLIILKLEKNAILGNAKIRPRQYHAHMILCLSNQYCIEIENGIILRCVQLPQLLDISHVALMTRFNDDRYIIVASKNKEVLAINVQTLKVVGTWQNSASILVDDFLNCGTDQLFVAMGTTTIWPPNQWILTDFYAHHIDQTSEMPTKDNGGDDYSANVGTTRAVRALGLRLQDDIIAVEEMEAASQTKSQFLHATQQNLERMSLGLELPPLVQQPDMVTIVNSSEKATSLSDQSHREDALAVEVSDPWQRIFTDKWIIGVDVRNVSQRILYDLKLSAVHMSGAVTSYSENISCTCRWPTDHLHMCLSQINRDQHDTFLDLNRNTIADQQLSPLHRTSVACFSSLEMFSDTPSVDYMLVLSWREQEENNGSTLEQMQRGDDIKYWCVTRISPTIEDIMRASTRVSFNVEEAATDSDSGIYARNIIAANLVQKSLSLVVQTSQTRLSTLSLALIRAGFNQHNRYGCLVGTGALESARIYIQTLNVRARTLIVFARNEQQLLMLVHHMYSVLPDDVIILPQKEAASKGLCHAAAKCLQEEIDYSVSSLMELVKFSEISGHTDIVSMDTGATGDIQVTRDEFAEQKVMMNEKKQEKIKVEKMVEFKKKLFAHQSQTDRAIGKLNKM